MLLFEDKMPNLTKLEKMFGDAYLSNGGDYLEAYRIIYPKSKNKIALTNAKNYVHKRPELREYILENGGVFIDDEIQCVVTEQCKIMPTLLNRNDVCLMASEVLMFAFGILKVHATPENFYSFNMTLNNYAKLEGMFKPAQNEKDNLNDNFQTSNAEIRIYVDGSNFNE